VHCAITTSFPSFVVLGMAFVKNSRLEKPTGSAADLEGTRPEFAERTADTSGFNGPHVFSLLEPQMLFADADNDYPAGFARQGLIATLSGRDTTLRVRRYDRQRLALDIVRNGKPVPGAVLWSDMGLGVCGAGYGPLATANSEGRIRVEAFFPRCGETTGSAPVGSRYGCFRKTESSPPESRSA
jgi:hypothetical protein